VSGVLGWFGLRRNSGAGDRVLLIAREVTDRVQSVQGGLSEIRQPEVLDLLSESDFAGFDQVVAEQAVEDREYAIVLARLVYAAARAKGMDRQIVGAALRLDSLLPGDDPSRERERLLHDAWTVAERCGYADGAREALHRLGMRALDAGETDRAKMTLRQQLTTGDETADGPAEIAAAIALGDRLRREGQRQEAQALYRRAGRAAQRLDDPHAIAESLVRQIELLPRNTDLATLAALQRQASEAARRTADLGLQSRIVLSLAETLQRNGKTEEAAAQLEQGLVIAHDIGDLSLEARCRKALVELEAGRARTGSVETHERELLALEERLGNRAGAADWAVRLGGTLLSLDRPGEAVDVFARGAELATAAGDAAKEQRSLGGLGLAYAMSGRPAEALESLMRALDLARKAGDEAGEIRWLTSIGETLWRFGQVEDASRALNDALTLARKIDDVDPQPHLLILLGRLYIARGQMPRARECLTRALEIVRRLPSGEERGSTLTALAALALETGQAPIAVKLYERATEMAMLAGDRAGAARLHLRLARVELRRGEAQSSADHVSQAVALAESAGDAGLVGQALQLRATSLHAAGSPDAVEHYLRVIDHCQKSGDLACEALMTVNLGFCLASAGRNEEAAEALRTGIGLARRQGEAGESLVRQADEALSALAEIRFGALATRPAANGGVTPAGAQGDDEVYGEATLPPG